MKLVTLNLSNGSIEKCHCKACAVGRGNLLFIPHLLIYSSTVLLPQPPAVKIILYTAIQNPYNLQGKNQKLHLIFTPSANASPSF